MDQINPPKVFSETLVPKGVILTPLPTPKLKTLRERNFAQLLHVIYLLKINR